MLFYGAVYVHCVMYHIGLTDVLNVVVGFYMVQSIARKQKSQSFAENRRPLHDRHLGGAGHMLGKVFQYDVYVDLGHALRKHGRSLESRGTALLPGLGLA